MWWQFYHTLKINVLFFFPTDLRLGDCILSLMADFRLEHPLHGVTKGPVCWDPAGSTPVLCRESFIFPARGTRWPACGPLCRDKDHFESFPQSNALQKLAALQQLRLEWGKWPGLACGHGDLFPMNQHHLTMEPTQHLFQGKKCPVHSPWAEIAVSQYFGPGVGKEGEVAGFRRRQESTDLRTVMPYRCSVSLTLFACLLSNCPGPGPLQGWAAISQDQGSIIHFFLVVWQTLGTTLLAHFLFMVWPLLLPGFSV